MYNYQHSACFLYFWNSQSLLPASMQRVFVLPLWTYFETRINYLRPYWSHLQNVCIFVSLEASTGYCIYLFGKFIEDSFLILTFQQLILFERSRIFQPIRFEKKNCNLTFEILFQLTYYKITRRNTGKPLTWKSAKN